MLILSPDEIRNTENKANENGLSYEDMMESAGQGCAEYIHINYPDKKNIVILCGKGKNGGDGFVIARYLKEADKKVSVIKAFGCPSDSLSEKNKALIDGTVNICDGSHLTKKIISLINSADIIVDAVFGIGFKGELPENIKELFAASARSPAVKIAVDMPSGLSAENESSDCCFSADETLSMLCFKKEHIYKPFSGKCGKVTVIPIGFGVFGNSIEAFSRKEIKALLPERPFNANKGTFGKAMIIAGSYNMPGAAKIAVKGALSTGAGLTTLCFPDCIYPAVTSSLSENTFFPVSSDNKGCFAGGSTAEITAKADFYDAVAIGPGIGVFPETEKLVNALIKCNKGRIIIDADGINIVSRNINILKESEAEILLTPHPGEMSRLTGKSIADINADREKAASDFAKEYGVTVLLKGANTVIAAPDGRIVINPTGSAALSRGGSGDLLTGIAASFAAQGLSVFQSAVLSAYIHGLAGEIAEKKYTSFSATIERIYDCIPDALSEIISGK